MRTLWTPDGAVLDDSEISFWTPAGAVLATTATVSAPATPTPAQPVIDVSRYNLVVREFFCRIMDNGGTIWQNDLLALHIFTNRLMRCSLWDKLQEIYPFCGQDLAAASIKLKYTNTHLMTNHGFAEEDFEEWGVDSGGMKCDGLTTYFDTGFSAADLKDASHLCYLEDAETGAGGASPVTAIGVTNGTLEWSLGAQVAVDDRTAILGTNTVLASTSTPYTNWSSLYIGNREDNSTLRLLKRTHLKATTTTASTVSPKPDLNFYIGARNNNNVADQFFGNRIRYASIGKAFTLAETVQYYQYVQALMNHIGRTV